MSEPDLVRLPDATHVVFDRSTQVIRCERCEAPQVLRAEDDKQFEILCFSLVHACCGSTRAADHAERVSRALFRAGFLIGLGTPVGDVAAACRQIMRGD